MDAKEPQHEGGVNHCAPGNRCNDMAGITAAHGIMWKSITGGLAVLVISAVLGLLFQWRGASAQITTAERTGAMTEKIGALEKSVDALTASMRSLASSVGDVMARMDYIQRKQQLQDYDQQRTRVYINRMAVKNGLEPIEVRPFEPPPINLNQNGDMVE